MLSVPSAAIAGGVWGPGIPYLDGVLCHSPDATTALVSWPGPSTGPAFALGAVTGPPRGETGPTTLPAVGGASQPLRSGGAGLSAAQAGAIAYLIAHHGSDDRATVADIAARIVGQVSGNVYVTSCLEGGVGGMSATVAAQLWNEAVANGGPYQVTVTGGADGATTGYATRVTAHVESASGAPVAGMTVSFAADAGIPVPATAVTDAAGQASVTLKTLPSDTAIGVTATISAISGLVETTGGTTVPLVSAAAPSVQIATLRLVSADSADPVVSVSTASSVIPTSTALHSSVRVTGLRGHRATASLGVYGPLAYSTSTGCRGHTAAEWTATRRGRPAVSGRAAITGDGTYAVATAALTRAGCYQLFSVVATSDAVPNVTRGSVGPVVAAVPITVATVPTGHGIAPSGPLRSTLTVQAGPGVSLRDVSATLVGPRAPGTGGCADTGWSAARAAAASTTVAAAQVASTPVTQVGCYGFRISGVLLVAGSSDTPVTFDPSSANRPVLVLAPTVTLQALSATSVDTGGNVQATVSVAGSDKQPGTLHLQLVRLPYTTRGCIGLNWDDAVAVTPAGTIPSTQTSGDGSYRVRTAAVPAKACWTVAPVFTANANGAVQATGVAGADPTLAFVSTAAPRAPHTVAQGPAAPNDTARLIATVVISGLLLITVLAVIVVLARRSRNAAAETAP